jgi:glycosyltransferase involved in cell wall biosynthesis
VARDPDRVVLASVMRLAARKRPLTLVRALRRARELVPPHIRLHAVVVGDGPQRAAIERYCARYGMQDWVQLTGPLSHDAIRTLYERADVFVNTAVLESFGIAALEARAAGVPGIGMRRSALGAFVDDGRTGLLVDDDRALAVGIARVSSDAGLRDDLAAQSRSSVPEFGWADALDHVEHAYARASALQEVSPRRRIGRRVVAEATP